VEFTTLLFVSTLAVSAPTGQKQIARAYYKQSGMEKTVKRIEHEQLSPRTRTALANAALVTSAVINQQIVFRWTFP
jgi:hypothetical protein